VLVLLQVASPAAPQLPPLPHAVSMYLNSGPGGLAGIFVHQRLAEEGARVAVLPCLATDILCPAQHSPALQAGGAMTRRPGVARVCAAMNPTQRSSTARFDMTKPFKAEAGARGFQLSNPPIFQAASLLASLDMFNAVGMQQLRAKSVLLTGYLQLLLQQVEGVSFITPTDPSQRGCQVCTSPSHSCSHHLWALPRSRAVGHVAAGQHLRRRRCRGHVSCPGEQVPTAITPQPSLRRT
jgi:kynureninase